jgi:hypothetical protein
LRFQRELRHMRRENDALRAAGACAAERREIGREIHERAVRIAKGIRASEPLAKIARSLGLSQEIVFETVNAARNLGLLLPDGAVDVEDMLSATALRRINATLQQKKADMQRQFNREAGVLRRQVCDLRAQIERKTGELDQARLAADSLNDELTQFRMASASAVVGAVAFAQHQEMFLLAREALCQDREAVGKAREEAIELARVPCEGALDPEVKEAVTNVPDHFPDWFKRLSRHLIRFAEY